MRHKRMVAQPFGKCCQNANVQTYRFEWSCKQFRKDSIQRAAFICKRDIPQFLQSRILECERKSLVAIDLKIGEFRPEYVGKMNYYLSLLDRLERAPDENGSIGVILCATKDSVEVELSLDGIEKPIGVADYQLLLPKEKLQKVLTDEVKAFESKKKKT